MYSHDSLSIPLFMGHGSVSVVGVILVLTPVLFEVLRHMAEEFKGSKRCFTHTPHTHTHTQQQTDTPHTHTHTQNTHTHTHTNTHTHTHTHTHTQTHTHTHSH